MKSAIFFSLFTLFGIFLLTSCKVHSPGNTMNLLLPLDFDKKSELSFSGDPANKPKYASGIHGKSLDMENSASIPELKDNDTSWFSNHQDFSLTVWVKSDTRTTDTTIIISNSDFRNRDAGIYGKRRTNNGFTIYSYNGAWGWNIGNGIQHYNYEPIDRDQPIDDNKWHQIGITFHSILKEIRLYYDGINKAVIHIGDLDERNFISELPLRIGRNEEVPSSYRSFQGMIDEFRVWGSTLSPESIRNDYVKYSEIPEEPELETDHLTVVNWNIWHGGTHFTREGDGFDGIERITELIRNTGADIVLMQETYGAGSSISSSLGFYYYEAGSTIGAVWGANLSVMSRFPFGEAYMVEKPSNYGNNFAFNNGGVQIRLSKDKNVIAFTNWYNRRKPDDLDRVLQAWSDIILSTDNIPVISGGDFNSVSHLDDGVGESGHSKLMAEAGFIDSYRQIHPDITTYPGYSNGGNTARIDYIYYKGKGLELLEAGPIVPDFKGKELKTPGYPSDHLGIVAKFRIN